MIDYNDAHWDVVGQGHYGDEFDTIVGPEPDGVVIRVQVKDGETGRTFLHVSPEASHTRGVAGIEAGIVTSEITEEVARKLLTREGEDALLYHFGHLAL